MARPQSAPMSQFQHSACITIILHNVCPTIIVYSSTRQIKVMPRRNLYKYQSIFKVLLLLLSVMMQVNWDIFWLSVHAATAVCYWTCYISRHFLAAFMKERKGQVLFPFLPWATQSQLIGWLIDWLIDFSFSSAGYPSRYVVTRTPLFTRTICSTARSIYD